MLIKVSSLTSSPDSSSSPIAIALGQVTNHQTPTTATVPGNNGTTYTSSTTTNNTTLQNTITDSKLWMANSTTASPHSLSPKTFTFDSGTNPSSTADSGNSSETLRRVNVIKIYFFPLKCFTYKVSSFSACCSQSIAHDPRICTNS